MFVLHRSQRARSSIVWLSLGLLSLSLGGSCAPGGVALDDDDDPFGAVAPDAGAPVDGGAGPEGGGADGGGESDGRDGGLDELPPLPDAGFAPAPVSESCQAFLDCLVALDPEALTDELNGAFGPGGTCWVSGPNVASFCSDQCAMELSTVQDLAEFVPECRYPPGADGGVLVDAGPEDAGLGDAGLDDAGLGDAGSPDAGSPDAGGADAGPRDAGPPDAALVDAGLGDAGGADAGPRDAGPPDAALVDAGSPDAG